MLLLITILLKNSFNDFFSVVLMISHFESLKKKCQQTAVVTRVHIKSEQTLHTGNDKTQTFEKNFRIKIIILKFL